MPLDASQIRNQMLIQKKKTQTNSMLFGQWTVNSNKADIKLDCPNTITQHGRNNIKIFRNYVGCCLAWTEVIAKLH